MIPRILDPRLANDLGSKGISLAAQLGWVSDPCRNELANFLTNDSKMLSLKNDVTVLAALTNQHPVFIHGETGTGKEIIARALHGCRAGNFIPVNCAAIPHELLESEFFGHKKGSFTGAVDDKLGLWKRANGGTIFLDEIGELPKTMQAKLLRVLQEKRVRGVGVEIEEITTARVVCASHCALEEMVVSGYFREDLYWRLAAFVLEVTPLRERREDIRLITKIKLDKEQKLTEDQARYLYEIAELRGNVRELEVRVLRYLILGKML